MTGEGISKVVMQAPYLNLETEYTHHFLKFTFSVPS